MRKDVETFASSALTNDMALMNLFEKLKDITQPVSSDSETAVYISDFFRTSKNVLNEVTSIVNSALGTIKKDNKSMPARMRGADISIFSTQFINVNLGLLTKASEHRSSLFSIPGDMLIVNIGRNEFSVNIFNIPESAVLSEFNANLPLTFRKKITLALRGTVALNCDKVVPEFLINDDAVILKFFFNTKHTVDWVFDKNSLLPRFPVASGTGANRIQAISRLLALWKDNTADISISIDILEEICQHEAHFVRWSAIQNLCNISPVSGKKALEHALNDHHPHIRAAAQASLKKHF